MTNKRSISPHWDPWDVWHRRQKQGYYDLTSIEFTVTNLCNLRCEHCAVGELLMEKEGIPIDTELIIRKLDEIDTLQTLSFTGGEPILNKKVVDQTLRPLLKYAKSRNIYTQLNSNLTLPLSRYEDWIEDVDVLHISYNYTNVDDFYRIVFHNVKREVSMKTAANLFEQMKENSHQLSKQGIFVSAESFLSPFTATHITEIHKQIAEMGCQRHEIHPLYPSDFAKDMSLLSLDEYRSTLHHLLENRNPDLWILLGTLPFFPCSTQKEDQTLWRLLHTEKNLTVRQDPDGRNRLNINAFTGDVIITDFGDVPPFGNIKKDRLTDLFQDWLNHPVAKRYHCFCETARCAGPNLLVANTYYPKWDFQTRKANISIHTNDTA